MDTAGGPGTTPEPAPDLAPPAARPGRRLRSPATLGWVAGGVVLAAVLVIALLAATSGSPAPAPRPRPPSASALYDVTHVPASVLDTVGVAGTSISSEPGGNPLALIKGPATKGDGLPAVGGRPVVFFFGALWCPFCATERWSMIVALSRFGTFTNLSSATSSPSDVYPSTPSWSFHGSTYTSNYIVFDPVEYQDENHQPLDALDSSQLAVLQRWDAGGSFPFLTIGNRFTAGLPPWLDPQLLHGLSQQQVAASLSDTRSQLGIAVNANANYLTAAMCAVDGDAPASVCNSAGVQAAAALLPHLPAAVPSGS